MIISTEVFYCKGAQDGKMQDVGLRWVRSDGTFVEYCGEKKPEYLCRRCGEDCPYPNVRSESYIFGKNKIVWQPI